MKITNLKLLKAKDLKELNGMTVAMLALLAKENIVTLNDFADLASDELTGGYDICLLYTSPSPRDRTRSRMPSSA